ncbi:SWIM zinc finger family protein [Methylocaldum sp.]|uniref:SWIM zinc finger family protein n=1 Tax=Methylocaldum sp. TaxID=1969727 RepID=UPI002D7478C7|nr:DUF6880 family protein [Methylocaldum sp.]HYE34374.1 SWIM zinc finger family protein [Methylocaldum sp.]
MANLEQLITPAKLKELAGAAAFERGEDYFAEGTVDRLHRSGDKLSARVMGSEHYHVELWADGDELGYDCTCPRAADGYFCKHCVAVGLALLDEREHTSDAGKQESKRDPESLIRKFLQIQSPEYLTGLLMDQAQRDDALYRSLLLKAERASGLVDTIKSFRKAIDSATRIRGFVDWDEAGGFASDLDELVDSLEELLTPGTANTLVDLAEYAIERVDRALEQVDDSDGEVGTILERLGALHVRACAMAKPDPIALAERLFRYETTSSFDTYYNSVLTYQDTLGPAGIARFRELAEQHWEKIKPKGAGDRQSLEDSSNRFHITRIMEILAQMSGDIEALVAVKSRDLSSPYRYLDIAEIYQKADQPDLALEWAERGLKAFPERPDNRLRDFLVGSYLERGRDDEALRLTWVQFEEWPTLEHYRKLHDVAEKLGRWPEQRQRALDWIEVLVLREANDITRWKLKPSLPDRSLRVEIALWENDLDTAWQTIQQGKCRRDLLLSLAGKLENPRPADAVTLYRRVIPGVIEETNNRAYEEAIRYIAKVGELMQTLGKGGDFGNYLADLRVQYKAKRNFIKLLDALSRQVAGH